MEIIFDHVSKSYKKDSLALDDVSFTLVSGICGLLGRNGAGKTTLLKILATILKADEGIVTFDGKNLDREGSLLRSNLGYLPQNSSLQPGLTIRQYLDYIAVLKGITDANDRRQQIDKVIELTGLKNETKKKLRNFSGGMLRRAGIAQMLLADPQVLVIDEPTAGLDPEERMYFKNLLSKIGHKRTVLLSTHIVSDIEDVCNNVIILDEGKVKYTGSMEEMRASVDGMIYECELTDDQKLEVVKAGGVLTSVCYMNDIIKVRYIAKEPIIPNSSKVDSKLEDAYLYITGGLKR